MDLKIMKAADEVNERQKSVLIERLHKHFGDLKGLKIAIWGLAFKPRTDDVRRAPSIPIIEGLVRSGATVSAFDPIATQNAQAASLATFESAKTALDAVKGADALLILTEWSEFKAVNLDELKKAMKEPVVFDGRNLFDPEKMQGHGIRYVCIGRNHLN
jgi:UDPglucose 6-dehydrogenase